MILFKLYREEEGGKWRLHMAADPAPGQTMEDLLPLMQASVHEDHPCGVPSGEHVYARGLTRVGNSDRSGLNYAYTHLDLHGKKLLDFDRCSQFKTLQHIDVSRNSIASVSCVSELPQLQTFIATKNIIRNINPLLNLSLSCWSSVEISLTVDIFLGSLHFADIRENSIRVLHGRFPHAERLQTLLLSSSVGID